MLLAEGSSESRSCSAPELLGSGDAGIAEPRSVPAQPRAPAPRHTWPRQPPALRSSVKVFLPLGFQALPSPSKSRQAICLFPKYCVYTALAGSAPWRQGALLQIAAGAELPARALHSPGKANARRKMRLGSASAPVALSAASTPGDILLGRSQEIRNGWKSAGRARCRAHTHGAHFAGEV